MWKRYETTYPSNPEGSFIANLCKAIKNEGLLNLLRHQFKDRGMKFHLCYFKPELSYNKEAVELYDKNILTCVRQLRYSLSNENSIDIILNEFDNTIISKDMKKLLKMYILERRKRMLEIYDLKDEV